MGSTESRCDFRSQVSSPPKNIWKCYNIQAEREDLEAQALLTDAPAQHPQAPLGTVQCPCRGLRSRRFPCPCFYHGEAAAQRATECSLHYGRGKSALSRD